MPVWLRKTVCPSIFAQFPEAGEKVQQTCALAREACNKCDLAIPVFEWPIIMICLGGFL
jgi:hypothetical protein